MTASTPKAAIALALLWGCLFHFSEEAQASTDPALKPIVDLACNPDRIERDWNGFRPIADEKDKDFEWVAIDPRRLLFFMIAQTGETTSPMDVARRAQSALDVANATSPVPAKGADVAIAEFVEAIQETLWADTSEELKVFGLNGRSRPLWPESSSRLELLQINGSVRCKVKKAATEPLDTPAPKPDIIAKSKPMDINLRGTVEALFLTGKERKTAPAAQLAVERVRSFLDDGSRKTVTTLTGSAVLGWMIAPSQKGERIAAYLGYELNRPRTKPFVAPTPPATIRDGDTELLKIGLMATQPLPGLDGSYRDTSLSIAFDNAYIFDLAQDAERYRGRIILSPYDYVPPGGMCGIRYFAPTFIPGVKANCTVDMIIQQNIVLKDGRLKAKLARDSILFGGRLSYDAMLTGDADAGAIAGAALEYQHRLHGAVPHVKQIKLYLKYRIWNGETGAIEFGPELTDGVNPESFEDENKLVLKAGIIF